jgi:hypothetical protein
MKEEMLEKCGGDISWKAIYIYIYKTSQNWEDNFKKQTTYRNLVSRLRVCGDIPPLL